MKIAYVVSQYPSLTETFVAREIEQVVREGHQVIICILRHQPSNVGPQGIMVEGVRPLRMDPGTKTVISTNIATLREQPLQYLTCWSEILVPLLCKPSRAFHVIYLLIAAIWFAKQLQGEGVEYVHSHFLHSEALVSKWLASLLNVPYGITAHVSSIRHHRKLIKRAVQDATVLAGDTQQTLSVIRELAGRNAKLIRNGVDLQRFQSIQPVFCSPKDGLPLILAVGSLLHPKGFHILIKACALLKKQNLVFHCRIIGDGEERINLKRIIEENNLENIVEMPGPLPFDSLIEEYKRTKILVMPSMPSPMGSDGLPTVLIEAMTLGIPVVATSHAGIPDLVRCGETGLVAEPGDAESLAKCIAQLLTDDDLCKRLSAQGRRLVEIEFDLPKNVSALISLMEQSAEKTKIGISNHKRGVFH